MRSGTAETVGVVRAINNAVDPANLKVVAHDMLAPNHVGDVEIALARPIAADPHADNPATGRIVIDFADRIAGGGLVLGLNPIEPAGKARRSCRARPRGGPRLAPLSPGERLAQLRQDIGGRIVFTTSFGLEDQVITHLLWEQNIDVELITLDTGRLFNETYALWAETEHATAAASARCIQAGAILRRWSPARASTASTNRKPARLACCQVRKVEPLERALAGAQAWITGLRAEQSAFRKDMALVAADHGRGLIKVNPLFDQTREQILAFVSNNAVPSTRCTPRVRVDRLCALHPRDRAGRTRARRPLVVGRPGRQECGLHLRRE